APDDDCALLLHVGANWAIHGLVRDADHGRRSGVHDRRDRRGVPESVASDSRYDSNARLLGNHTALATRDISYSHPKLFAYAASLCRLRPGVPPFARRTSAGEQKASVYLRDLPAQGEDLQRHQPPRPQQTHRPRTPSKSNTHSSPPPRAAKPKAQPAD